jgi:DNA-binding XRE family transcriptional regulator
MLTPSTPLPAFDQLQVDKRFLAELTRLYEAQVFATYRDWAITLGVNPNYVAAIESGRYHANLKLLYDTARHYPAFDFQYVVFGSAVYARPEPGEVPKRVRGRRPKVAGT